MDPVARAKKAYFACLGVGVALLFLVNVIIGPAAFAVPPLPVAPSAGPRPETSATPSNPSATSASASASALVVASASAVAAVDADAPPVAVAALPKYAGGKTSGVVATFEFEQASADLSALQALAKQLHDDLTSEIVLEGHSDPSGNEYRNLTLSLDRANWAADRLVEYGINRMRIRTVGLGSARPIVDIGGDAGAINRRVEVRWILRTADGGGR